MIIRVGTIVEIIEKETTNTKEITIIGAGKDGKAVANALLQFNNVIIKQFVDDNPSRQKPSYYKNIDCVKPSEAFITEKSIIIICIGEFCFYDDEDIFRKNVIKGLKCIPDTLYMLDRCIEMERVFLEKCHEKGVDVDNTNLIINGIKYPNYLKMGGKVKRSFLVELGDLILPELFDEWSWIDEGPYRTHNLKAGDNVIDAGANIGVFSVLAAQKGCNVYAFEPISKTREVLEAARNIYNNITIIPYALADKMGKVTMSSSDNLSQNKIVYDTNAENIEEIKCITVDEFVKTYNVDHIDFIKADIEGAERKMLLGAKNTLLKDAPKLSICTYHFDDDPEILENIIRDSNNAYEVIHEYKKLFAFVK